MQDELDRLILIELQEDARISNAELARRVQLSPPATLARIRRLEESGLIQGYTAILDRKLLGYDLMCFINVNLQVHNTEQLYAFRSAIRVIPRVLECHHTTGDYDYLLKVVARDTADLEDFLVNQLTPAPGVARIHTSVVLSETKSLSSLDLP
jgi:Lrp/AsnC family transcriptional regulator, leucine-responsive regulatory protein